MLRIIVVIHHYMNRPISPLLIMRRKLWNFSFLLVRMLMLRITRVSFLLHYAATKNAAAMLIASGSGVNTKGQNGLTPLHARAQASVEVVELLIEKDADVNALDFNGNTPLDITRDPNFTYNSVERERIANLLRKHGAKTAKELKAEGK